MTDPLDRPLTLRDALTVFDALRFHSQMRGRPHEHWLVAIDALQPSAAAEPVELADYAEQELAKAITAAEDAAANVERWRQKAREFRAATDALRAADQRKVHQNRIQSQ